jgi:hypothetical protein
MIGPRDFGKRPELTWLPVDRLDVDPAYQRSLDTPRGKRLVQKIVDNFRWASFQAILAAPAAERWLIIDGQHRVRAARLIGLGLVPAVVIHDLSQADQAAAFVGANRDRVAVSAQALFHARVAAGEAAALTVARLCAAAGIEVARSNQAANSIVAGKTAAVPALLYMLRTYGETNTGTAIAAVAAAYGMDRGTLRSPFFIAAARYISDGSGSEGELRAALVRIGWRKLEAAGAGLGGYTMVPAILALLRGSSSAEPEPPKHVPVASDAVPSFRPPQQRGFRDDPRAKADHGSPRQWQL